MAHIAQVIMSNNSDRENTPPTGEDAAPPPTGDNVSPPPFQNFINHITSNKVEAVLWMMRLSSIAFTILYLLPLGVNPITCYQRVLMSNAATSALRLHQRLPNFRFNREFLGNLLIEDSCHYLLFSLIFLYTQPITICLVPIFLFALLHSASYTLTSLQLLDMENSWLAQMVNSMVQHQQRNMLRVIAISEILIMPMTVVMIFSGKGGLLAPFVYFRFLTLRYASRRNPYTRTAFHEMRLTVEGFARHPNCPGLVRQILDTTINFASRLAPPMPPPN